jgi:hypothetical protein
VRSVSVRMDRGPAIASHVLHLGEMILHIQHIPHPALEPFAKLVTFRFEHRQTACAHPVTTLLSKGVVVWKGGEA